MRRVSRNIIRSNINIKQAMKQMDEAGEKTLFVTEERDMLLGTVTDGDIRRWILKGSGLSEPISKVMNASPVFLKEGYSRDEAKELMLSKVIECIPVVDDKKRIISTIRWLDLFGDSFKRRKEINKPVVIMAGGQGSRLAPFTHILPKPLIPIRGKPIIELIIDKFVGFGCDTFYLSVNYKANLLKAYFNDIEHDYKIIFIHEDAPLGTAGSLSFISDAMKETFFLSNCDILIEADYADILDFHKINKNKITLITSMKQYVIPYGVCEIKNGGDLKRIREKPEYSFLINTGMYVLDPEVLSDIPKNKFYNITDLIIHCMKKKERVGVYPISEQSWIDIGEWEKLHDMMNRLGEK